MSREAQRQGSRHTEVAGFGLLLDDLDNPARARLDQDRALIHDRVPILLPHAVLRRYAVIDHAALRKHGSDTQVFVVGIGRDALFDDIFPEAGCIVADDTARDRSANTTDHSPDRAADNSAAHGACCSSSSGSATSALWILREGKCWDHAQHGDQS
ncbi:hypothetical protein ASE61_19110 [Bosea sp. Root670]|nr:hypothetical protein ASE61_19110 [Bosea sp. Root670]